MINRRNPTDTPQYAASESLPVWSGHTCRVSSTFTLCHGSGTCLPAPFFPHPILFSTNAGLTGHIGIAFLARPSEVHSSATSSIALCSIDTGPRFMTMGLATFAIGVLPRIPCHRLSAPLLLALCRFGQGIGLGGRWVGAVLLLAVETHRPISAHFNGPCSFRTLGRPSAFLLSGGTFLLLSRGSPTSSSSLSAGGWPFLATRCCAARRYGSPYDHRDTRLPASDAGAPIRLCPNVLRSCGRHTRALPGRPFSWLARFVPFYLMTSSHCLGGRPLSTTARQLPLIQLFGILSLLALRSPSPRCYANGTAPASFLGAGSIALLSVLAPLFTAAYR